MHRKCRKNILIVSFIWISRSFVDGIRDAMRFVHEVSRLWIFWTTTARSPRSLSPICAIVDDDDGNHDFDDTNF